MQKVNIPLIIDLDEEAIKKDILMRRRAKRTIDENLWDTSWLKEKYPDRFDAVYEKWELGNDQFDPALFPEKQEEENNL